MMIIFSNWFDEQYNAHNDETNLLLRKSADLTPKLNANEPY